MHKQLNYTWPPMASNQINFIYIADFIQSRSANTPITHEHFHSMQELPAPLRSSFIVQGERVSRRMEKEWRRRRVGWLHPLFVLEPRRAVLLESWCTSPFAHTCTSAHEVRRATPPPLLHASVLNVSISPTCPPQSHGIFLAALRHKTTAQSTYSERLL